MRISKNQEKWIKKLYKMRLLNLTATVLEALGPINVLSAQLVYLAQPMISPFLTDDNSQEFASILENPSETANFIKLLKEYDPGA
jgi:hypothetical protein